MNLHWEPQSQHVCVIAWVISTMSFWNWITFWSQSATDPENEPPCWSALIERVLTSPRKFRKLNRDHFRFKFTIQFFKIQIFEPGVRVSQGLENVVDQPSDKQISISKYPIQGPCIKCTEKSWNRACKNTTYRIRVQSVPHTGDLRMYEHSHEPFFASSSMGQNLQTYGIALKHVWQHSKTLSFQGPGNVEHESGLKT